MQTNRQKLVPFYERVLDTILLNLHRVENSELKLLLLINRMTTGANLSSVQITLNDFELFTGLSRKTIINALNQLEENELIERGKNSLPHTYSINRKLLFEWSFQGSESQNRVQEIISKRQAVEKLNQDRAGIPLVLQKAIRRWNATLYRRLDLTNKFINKCIQSALKTGFCERAAENMGKILDDKENLNAKISDYAIKRVFGVEEGRSHE